MRFLLPVLLVVLALAGCDTTEDEADLLPLLPDDARYAWSLEQRFLETDSLVLDLHEEARVRTVSRDASVPGYNGLVEIEATLSESGVQRTWYEQTAEALREVAYASPGRAVIPRGTAVAADVFALPYTLSALVDRYGASRSEGETDSLTVRDDPRVVYELPLEIGASWVSFTNPFRSTREVLGRERVTVEAGTFDCLVVRTEIDLIPDSEQFEWLDYVSKEHGLVLRTTESVQEYRGPDNDVRGLMRSVERLELTSGR